MFPKKKGPLSKRGALEGVRVLDCSLAKAGPTCGQILADIGAEVIRVEMPGGAYDRDFAPYAPNGQSYYLAYTCRNKKGITLNLKSEKGKKIFKRLLKQTDILIENLGPKGSKAVGLDYGSLKKVKKDIIVISVSGFGQDGPYADRYCFDAVAQAMSGVMWITGFPEHHLPVRLGVSWVDTATGVYAALGSMVALYHRQNTGKGQFIDLSLLDVALSFMESTFGEYKVSGKIRPQIGNANLLVAPYDAYKAKDGWIYLSTGTENTWLGVCKATGREDIARDPRFKSTQDRNKPESRQFFKEWLGQWVGERTVKVVVEQFNRYGVPCGPVNTIPDVLSDPHVQARETILELDHKGIGKVPIMGSPIRLSETPPQIRTAAPEVGEHNREIYGDLLGLSPEEISKLEKEGVI